MPGSKIQADYGELTQMMGTFSQHADHTRELLQAVTRCFEGLHSGGWIGTGAEAFFEEMSELVFPAVNRLAQSLDDASSATKRLADIFHTAEDEACRCFDGSGGGTASDGQQGSTGDQGGSGTPGSTTPPPGHWPVNLNDPAQVNALLHPPKVQGADTKALNDVMLALNSNPRPTGAALDGYLNQLAQIRGVPVDQMRGDWNKFLALEAQQKQIGASKGLDPVSQLKEGMLTQGNAYMGTSQQMRFGQVIGDAFGIDPVFGALLSPTGGIVGPGDSPLHLGLQYSDAVNTHGVVHDAAGYLNNYHNIGPGYRYAPSFGPSLITDTTNPLAGQVDGIAFWLKQTAPKLPSFKWPSFFN